MRFREYPHLKEMKLKLAQRLVVAAPPSVFRISVPVLAGVLRLADSGLLLTAVALACSVHAFASVGARNQDVLTAVIAAGVTALSFRACRGYTLAVMRSVRAQAERMALALALGVVAMVGIFFVLQAPLPEERGWVVAWLVSAAGLLALSRLVLFPLMRRWAQMEAFTNNVAVVGDAELCCDIAAGATAGDGSYQIVGIYEDRPGLSAAADGEIAELITRCRQERIDTIVIAVPLHDRQRIANVLRQLSVTVSDIYLATDVAGLSASGQQIIHIASVPAVLLKQRPLKDWEALQKRAFDVVLAGVLLVFLAPFMALIALAIKLDSPGPVLFRQPRFGFNNNMFNVYKFRTMRHEMADLLADQQTKKNDKRITRVGKWLRKLSLDELPQLQNVLLGDMSLVGPRPHAPNTKAAGRRFTDIMAETYALRHRVRPGITGWAQVNGWRGETQTVEQLENRVACDLHYIENWSLFFDAKILLLTLRRGIASPQAY
jgi:Undecaprenyl-phosphate glucose phosphotransferase